MPLPTGDVIGILADNLRLRKSVLPISKRNVTRWARGLDIPDGGQTVLYTGMMYQLIPYIEGLVKAEVRLGDSPLAKLTALPPLLPPRDGRPRPPPPLPSPGATERASWPP